MRSYCSTRLEWKEACVVQLPSAKEALSFPLEAHGFPKNPREK